MSHPHYQEAFLTQLSQELRSENAATVLLALEDLERQGPLPQEGWSLRGKALMLQHQPENGLASLKAGLEAHPSSVVLQLNLAAAHLALGEALKALELLEPLELSPTEEFRRRAALLRNRALAASQCGQHSLAVRDLEVLRQLEGESEGLLWSLAQAYEQVEALDKAALLYRLILRKPEEVILTESSFTESS